MASVNAIVRFLQLALVVIFASFAFFTLRTHIFYWHPVLMTLGYLIFMAEGLIRALKFRPLTGNERVAAIESHASLQTRALLCIFLGLVAILRHKALKQLHHLYSAHSKFGVAVLVLTVLVPIGGALCFRKLGFIQRFPEKWHPWIKALHRMLGTLTWFLSLLVIELGLPHKAVYKIGLTEIWQVSIILCGAVMGMALSIRAPKVKDLPVTGSKAT